MKLAKVLTVFVVALVLVSGAYAGQGLKLSVGTGYSMTAFEDQDDAAGTLPLSLTLAKEMSDNLFAGLEVFYPLGGYTWEVTESYYGQTYKYDVTYQHYMIGVFGKYFVSEKPYVKAGVGMFMGGAEMKSDDFGDQDADVDSGIGFCLGVGAQVSPKINVEFNYRIVSREPEGASEKYGMNVWDILVQYGFDL